MQLFVRLYSITVFRILTDIENKLFFMSIPFNYREEYIQHKYLYSSISNLSILIRLDES